jgi:colanic acid/amylovoran biosynthesis protein
MNIVIANTVSLNGGDAAIVHGILAILERAFGQARICVIDDQASVARRLFPHLEFEQRFKPAAPRNKFARFAHQLLFGSFMPLLGKRFGYHSNRRRYANADLVISTGGTYLVEHYNIRERFVQLWLAIETRRPVVLFTQSFGPFQSDFNKRWMRYVAKRAELVMVRDALSVEHLTQIGASTERVVVTADAAFALADLTKIASSTERKRGSVLRVGVSVRFWKHYRSGDRYMQFASYVAAVAALIERLLTTKDAEVTFISTCQGIPEYAFDDSSCAEMVLSLVRPEHRSKISLNKDFHRPSELMEILSTFDMVVATRMHMAILAMCVGVPTLGIAYEFKTRELFKKLGLEQWVVDIEQCSVDLLPELAGRMSESLGDVRRQLSTVIPKEQISAFQIVDRLKALMRT